MRRNRRNQPSLLRTAARASVVSSAMTASSQATSNVMHNKAARRSATDPQPQQIEMGPPPAAVESQPASPPTDLVAQLAQLAQLKEAGALTDDEFQIAKAKLLGTNDAAE
ncbi:SHOCT domain-containing protein [Nodosilinea nodulosa]|uniref:SHOCT domain-containing protein n=1 Tax=Nodosilinea nodulosa TaxID=416001 RepID=UPI0002F1A13A|nr:SHOCT domain-containing protein [Nodosilinea nodulosa]